MNRNEIERRFKDYQFFHQIDLGNGLVTPGPPVPENKKIVLEQLATLDLMGKRVLDIGCANGLFAFAAERQGAEVLAVDNTALPLEPMKELLIPYLESNIEVQQRNILDLKKSDIGEFDLILTCGLLYHLRYPFWALKIVKDLTAKGGTLILETAVLLDNNRHAILYCPNPNDSPYGKKSRSGTFFNMKALCETLNCLGFRVKSEFMTTKPWKRILQQGARRVNPSYQPIGRVILICEQDMSVSEERLLTFYDGTMER